jgi:phosphoribosylanthranilate isomerase
VKICGLTSVEDALTAVDLGADYLGLNFYPPSPRFLEEASARRIAEAVAGRCPLVGVFAGARTEVVARTAERVGLEYLQFHGDEPMEWIEPFADRAFKVFRVGDSLDDVDLGGFEGCWGYMLDRRHQRLLGGTGESWDWGLARRLETDRPLFVAGGIGPESAHQAAASSGAFGLDVCSGVEDQPGRKSRHLMEQLFRKLESPANTSE